MHQSEEEPLIFIKRHLSSQLPVADVAPCHGKAKYIEEGTGWDPHLSPFQRIGEKKTKNKDNDNTKTKGKDKDKGWRGEKTKLMMIKVYNVRFPKTNPSFQNRCATLKSGKQKNVALILVWLTENSEGYLPQFLPSLPCCYNKKVDVIS